MNSGEKDGASRRSRRSDRNPLELQAALIFAVLFSVMSILTAVTLKYLGTSGMFGLSFLTGLTDVDPFVMSLTQSAGSTLAVSIAAKGVVIATASNNLMKGIYSAVLGGDGVREARTSLFSPASAPLSLITLFFVGLTTLSVMQRAYFALAHRKLLHNGRW